MDTTKNNFYRRALAFEKDKYPKIEHYLKAKLEEHDFKVSVTQDSESTFFLLSQQSKDRMLHEAQLRKIKKNKTSTIDPHKDILPPKVVEYEKRRNFLVRDTDKYYPSDAYTALYEGKKSEEWGLGLFTEIEMLYLELKILESIPLIKEEVQVLLKDSKVPLTKEIEDELETETSLLYFLRDTSLLTDSYPLHISNFKEEVTKKAIKSLKPPVSLIRSYYGDKIAIYYAWIQNYTSVFLTRMAVVARFTGSSSDFGHNLHRG